MGPKLMPECSLNRKDQCEFILLITVQTLTLTDSGKNRGFEDIALTFTIDSNVIKIDNVQSSDENVNIQREVIFQASPEYFSKKLRESPIMINLARECMDLGTVKVEITDCFADAVLCDDFSSERMICDYKFENDGMENASMELSLQAVRKSVDNEGIKDFLRTNAKRRDQIRNKAQTVIPKLDSSVSSSDTSFMCDADLLKELCPFEDKTFHSFSSKTKHSKALKCLSDIAASLDIHKCSNVQKTFCRGCRGLSISGITCENKMRVSKKDVKDLKNSKNSEIFVRPLNRICSECFANLSILPEDAPCPKCSNIKKPQNEEKTPKPKELHVDISPNCIKKMVRDILSGEKKTCKDGLQHQNDLKVKCKSRKKQKGKGQGKCSMLSRCTKVKRANKVSSGCKKSLRIKHYGVVLGHKCCQNDSLLVPKNMGWLWNVEVPGITNIRRGWKPGAVPKPVATMMKHFLKKECEPPAEGSFIESMNEYPTPSVQVEKKLAKYKITLNPLGNKSHGEDASPIVFNISKYDDTMLRLDAKRFLKNRGVTKTCKCKNICECSCIDDSCRKRFIYEIETISQVMKINPAMKYEDLNDISEGSEIDFEFTPPFKMMNKCKRDVRVSVAMTQYEEPKFEQFDETEESSEHDKIVVKKTKVKKIVKRKSSKDKKKVQGPNSRSKPSEILREIEPKHCCVSYCRPNLDDFKCEIGDRRTTNYNPLYLRCLPNYSDCPPPVQTNCKWNSCYNVMNC